MDKYIALIGSYARGYPSKRSDLDLLSFKYENPDLDLLSFKHDYFKKMSTIDIHNANSNDILLPKKITFLLESKFIYGSYDFFENQKNYLAPIIKKYEREYALFFYLENLRNNKIFGKIKHPKMDFYKKNIGGKRSLDTLFWNLSMFNKIFGKNIFEISKISNVDLSLIKEVIKNLNLLFSERISIFKKNSILKKNEKIINKIYDDLSTKYYFELECYQSKFTLEEGIQIFSKATEGGNKIAKYALNYFKSTMPDISFKEVLKILDKGDVEFKKNLLQNVEAIKSFPVILDKLEKDRNSLLREYVNIIRFGEKYLSTLSKERAFFLRNNTNHLASIN